MIDLTGTSIATAQNSSFHVDSKLVAIHGIDVINSNNIKDKIAWSITDLSTEISMMDDWTGFTGFICINDEILYVTESTSSGVTVLRGQFGTIPRYHSMLSDVYTITILKNVTSYEWAQSIGLTDRDLFTTEISNGKIVLDDLPKNWNKLYDGCLYSFKRNKEVFIWEGCDGELVKVWEGVTTSKTGESSENTITINISDYFYRYADEPIRPVAVFNNIRPKELLEALFTGFTAKYVGNEDENDYFKINNLSTSDYSTYRDFLNYICKEYAIRLLFRKDKTIHILSDLYSNKITPVDNIQTELTKINDDSSGDIIINSISGVYKERKPLKDTSYTPIRFRRNKVFTSTINIIQNGVFQTLTLTNLSYDDISTMTYQEYQMIRSTATGKSYFCKLADIVKVAPNNYTVTLYAGIDKVSKWNELGRNILEGDISITNFTLYWSYDELPIIWKYGMQIDGNDTTSNLMLPLYPSEDFVFYIDKFGVADTSDGKFSGIVRGFETLLNQDFTNTQLYYNQEYNQNLTVPIYLYTNKIATNSTLFPNCNSTICIGSIDNSDVTLRLEYSDVIIKSSSTNNVVKFESSSNTDTGLYKCTIKNTLTPSSTNTITPVSTMAGQRLLKLTLSDYNLCNVGDALKLVEVSNDDVKYSTYLGFQNARYLITTKFTSGGEYFITLNDYYPMAIDTEFSFVKYNRQDIILLNELYFRANPIMESETTYEYTNDESISEFGTKNYTLEGKSLIKGDFLKIVSYVKDTYNGVTTNGIRNRLRTEMVKRLDLEAGDIVTVTDSVYTQYKNQKVLITNKSVKVDTNGNRDESYEMITVGNYSISPDTLGIKNVVSWNPDVIPTYNHYGTEGSTEQKQDAQIDNNRIVLQDLTEGQIYLEEISQSDFYGTTNVSSVITSDIQTFELGIVSSATGNYWNNLFALDAEGVIKINSEYMSYKSLGYTTGNATVQIIARGLGNSKKGDITSNIRIQFYKTIAKISASGMKSTDLSLGDGTNNYIEVHTDTGVEIESNKKLKISNLYNELFFDNTDNSSYLYINNNKIKLGKNAISAGKDGFLITIDSNNYLSYNITDSTFEVKTQKGYIGGSTGTSTYFDITNGSLQLYKSATDNLSFTTAGGLVIKSQNTTINTPSDNNYLSLVPTSSILYLGKNGSDVDVQIGSTSGSYFKFLNGSLDINTSKFNLTDTASTSLISLNNGSEQIGTGITLSGWTAYNGLFVGDTTVANENYIKYDIANSRFTFGNNVQIAGVMKTGDQIRVVDVSANTVVKCGELISGVFGFDYTSPTNPTTEYFRLSDSTLGQYKQGLVLKTQGIIDISNTNNALYFDPTSSGNNSYIGLNKATNYYSVQIGKVTEKSNGTEVSYNGFFFGNPESGSSQYLKYSNTSGIVEFNGKYFNETAYVSTDVEFIGACDTSKSTILKYDENGNLTITALNPFYGKLVTKIDVRNYIDISNINTGHFSKSGYIVPSSSIRELTSSSTGTLYMGGTTSTLSNKKFGFYITNPINFSNIEIANIGSDLLLFGGLYGAYLSSDNIHFVNCVFSNILEKIYSAGNFNNISINDTKVNLSSNWKICFERMIYMTNIHTSIYVDQNVVLFGTEALFKNCKNLNNIYIDSIDYLNNIYKSQIFYDCNNISNVYINHFKGIIAAACKNISNVFLDHYTPYTTENRALFSAIVGLNNFRSVESITGTTQIFFNVNNITNCSVSGLLPIHYEIILRDKNNSWNDNIITKTSNYTIQRDEIILNSNASTSVTYTLPLANLYHENRIYTIKDISGTAKTNNITIQRQGSDTIDGTTSVVINANYGSVSFYSDGTTWRRLISPTIFGY